MDLKYISSPSNETVKKAARLQKKRGRDEAGMFLIEGAKLVDEAVRSGAAIVTLFVEAGREDDYADLLRGISAETVILAPAVMKRISDTVTPQGIAAAVRINGMPELKAAPGGRYLALENLQDPGNVGTIFRTADAFGISGVILVGDYADIYSPKVIRAGMGAVFRVPTAHMSAGGLSDFLRPAGIRILASTLRGDAEALTEVDFAGTVVAIGNEGSGLSDGILAMADGFVTIPMAGGAESLNAAAAATIIMWEMARSRI